MHLSDFAIDLIHCFGAFAGSGAHFEYGFASIVYLHYLDLVLRYHFVGCDVLSRHCFPELLELGVRSTVIFIIFEVVLLVIIRIVVITRAVLR